MCNVKITQLACILSIILLICISLYCFKEKQSNSTTYAVNALKALYEFDSAEQLNTQMADLKKICTKTIFTQLTIDNEERTLNTYLKFKDNPVRILFEEIKDGLILYHLDTVTIDSERLFGFSYSVNNGRIDNVREFEVIEFY